MPFRKPTRMGRERKSASAPSLRKLAPMQKSPASAASVTESDRYRASSPPASGATTAATRAQVAASGPTTSCREVPNSA